MVQIIGWTNMNSNDNNDDRSGTGENITPVAKLGTLIEVLEQERARIQVTERDLSSQEQQYIEWISRMLRFLRQAVSQLKETQPLDPEPNVAPPTSEFVDGRYVGGNQDLYVDLRVDEAGSGVISADLYRTGPGGRTYDASIRTNPGIRVSRSTGIWQIVATDREGRRATGQLSLETTGTDNGSLTGSFSLDAPIGSLPVRTNIRFTMEYASEQLRSLGIELEREEDIEPLPTYRFEGRNVTVQSSLKDAGIQVTEVGELTRVPEPRHPWGNAQLHTLMVDLAQASLARPDWELHLLLLSQPSRPGLLGIMFDDRGPLPRQGAAVFASEIQELTHSDHRARKLIQTTVHELGHALNLVHRFEREVGRADSTSFMNYDWHYKGGGHRDEFWQKFDFTFDTDELEFLRHGPRPAVIPGGAPFHSARYWSDASGGYVPYAPEVEIPFLSLTLSPPQNGPIFDFAQPVFLAVKLTNDSNRPIELAPQWLDPKSGLLDIVIRKRHTDSEARTFVPVTHRCYDIAAIQRVTLQPGESMKNNLNLTFGCAGFPFAEPGEYEVTAVMAFPNQEYNREFVIRSDPLRIRVRYPDNRIEEENAEVLLREDVGLYFALGGSRGLPEAHDDLEEIRDHRQDEAGQVTDPIVACITRCQGIDVGRPYIRYRDGEFIEESGDREKAAELLEKLEPETLEVFDAHTAESTQKLAQKHRQATET